MFHVKEAFPAELANLVAIKVDSYRDKVLVAFTLVICNVFVGGGGRPEGVGNPIP